jgi:hypothetical protein
MYYLIVLLGSKENITKEVAKLSDVKEARATYGVQDILSELYLIARVNE